MTPASYDWRSITALNTSSTLAQIGQFGIPFVVLPLWLEQQGASTLQLSLFASSLWLGQLPGLYGAPRMTHWLGARRVVLMALLVSALSLGLMATHVHALWIPAGLLAGFGQGLRWIGLEPWLYNIAPGHARGRLVGFHESLIALAPIVAPALCGWLGIEGATPLLLGIGFVLVAALPLAWATEEPRTALHPERPPGRSPPFWRLPKETLLLIGVVVALWGGMSESAFTGLFSIYGKAHQLDGTQIASLLISFGAGGLLLQYAAGWLADHRGVAFACLTCSACTAGMAVLLTLPLSMAWLHVAVFALGGLITAYLTLALIASAKASSGTMARNMSLISMVYTATAIVGPLLAGGAITVLGGNGLMWALATFAVVLTVWLIRIATRRRGVVAAR